MSLATSVVSTFTPCMHVPRNGQYRVPRYYQGLKAAGERIAEPDPQVQKLFSELKAASSVEEASEIVEKFQSRWQRDLLATRVALNFLDHRLAEHRTRMPIRKNRTDASTFIPFLAEFDEWNTRLVNIKRARRPLLRKLDYLPARLFVLGVIKREASK